MCESGAGRHRIKAHLPAQEEALERGAARLPVTCGVEVPLPVARRRVGHLAGGQLGQLQHARNGALDLGGGARARVCVLEGSWQAGMQPRSREGVVRERASKTTTPRTHTAPPPKIHIPQHTATLRAGSTLPTWRRKGSYANAPAAASHTKPLRSGSVLMPGASTLTVDTWRVQGHTKGGREVKGWVRAGLPQGKDLSSGFVYT